MSVQRSIDPEIAPLLAEVERTRDLAHTLYLEMLAARRACAAARRALKDAKIAALGLPRPHSPCCQLYTWPYLDKAPHLSFVRCRRPQRYVVLGAGLCVTHAADWRKKAESILALEQRNPSGDQAVQRSWLRQVDTLEQILADTERLERPRRK